MTDRFYAVLAWFSRIFGLWFFALVARGIAFGYLVRFPGRAAEGIRFYRALSPHRGRLYGLWCTFRQFQNFTTVFMDRLLLENPEAIRYTVEGWEHLENLLKDDRGAVLLMSHLGNWEIAAHLLRRNLHGTELLLYMGIREKEEIERRQKRSLKQSGVRIHAVDTAGGSPFDLVDGIRVLRAGGLVSMTGDRIWRADQRAVPATFLGHSVSLPAAPHLLALIAEVPILVFFAFRQGPGRYHFMFCDPILPTPTERADRERIIAGSAQAYADLLAAAAHRAPGQWYHFEPFLGALPENPERL